MHDGGRRRTSLDDSVQRSRRRRTLGGRPAWHGGTVRAYLRNRRSQLHRSVAWWDCASVSQKPAVPTPPQRGTVGLRERISETGGPNSTAARHDGTVRAYLRNRRSQLHRSAARWDCASVSQKPAVPTPLSVARWDCADG